MQISAGAQSPYTCVMADYTREIPRFNESTFRQTVEIERVDLSQDAGASIRGREDSTRASPPSNRRHAHPPPPLPRLRTAQSKDPVVDLEIGETIAEGGMSLIKRGTQVPLKRQVAIKTTHDDDSQRARNALLEESWVTGHLEHPNVIPVYVLGEDERGSPVIVMKQIEGVSWDVVLKAPDAAPRKTIADLDFHLEVLLQVTQAVRFAHSRGIVHRDLKPENVMLGNFGEVYVLDWGLAVGVGSDAPDFVTPRANADGLRGTPAYMAPEMTMKTAELVDERTDVFLLGATLFEILYEIAPFWTESTIQSLVRAHASTPLKPPVDAPPELSAIARRAMSRDPNERFESVDAFREAIEHYRAHREAIELTNQAQRRMHRLTTLALSDPEDEATELLETYFETRYALKHALREWPDNRPAQETLNRLAQVMFEYFLKREDFGSATGCLSDMHPADRPPYARRLQAERSEYEKLRAEVEQIRYDEDARVEVERRLLLGIAISAIWSCSAFYKAYQRWGIDPEQIPRDYLTSLIPTVGVPLVAIFIFRRMMASNAFNRRVFLFVFAGLSAVVFMRVAAWHYDVSWHVTTTMEHGMYAMIAFLFGVATDMRIARATVLLVAAAILGVIFPMYQLAFMGTAFLLFAPYQVWLWTHLDEDAERKT